MTIAYIDDLLNAYMALIDAEALLNRKGSTRQTAIAHRLRRGTQKLCKGVIDEALAEPGSVEQRDKLLKCAVDLDGIDSPLVARAARALAKSIDEVLVAA